MKKFWQRPRSLWIRRAIFQVHLWTGLVFGLYLFAIGVSGAILVFLQELTPKPVFATTQTASEARVDFPAVAAKVHKAYPNDKLLMIYFPTADVPYIHVFMNRKKDAKVVQLAIQPATGQLMELPAAPRWLAWTRDLHVYLLAGRKGLIANGIGASVLLLLCVSGLLIWWPGVRLWKRALCIRPTGNWKRLNWNLHNTVGLWTLTILSMWAVSGMYLAWSMQFIKAIGYLSRVDNLSPPQINVPARTKGAAAVPLEVALANAQQAAPESSLFAAIAFPITEKDPLTVFRTRDVTDDLTKADVVYLDPATGKYLGVWHRGMNPTLGSRFILLLRPLHIGTQWGMTVKVIWATLGLALPLLFLSGALMYWNRKLSTKWKAIGRTLPTGPKREESTSC